MFGYLPCKRLQQAKLVVDKPVVTAWLGCAQVAANQKGIQLVGELIHEYDLHVVGVLAIP